jgi:hypothetical protein
MQNLGRKKEDTGENSILYMAKQKKNRWMILN